MTRPTGYIVTRTADDAVRAIENVREATASLGGAISDGATPSEVYEALATLARGLADGARLRDSAARLCGEIEQTRAQPVSFADNIIHETTALAGSISDLLGRAR